MWNPIRALESLADLLGGGQSFDKIYNNMKSAIEVIDQWDDKIIGGIKYIECTKMVTIPDNAKMWIDTIINTEQDSMNQIKVLLDMMEEAEKSPATNTPFEKVNAVVTKATEVYQETHPNATVDEVKDNIIKTGNLVNSIYKIAKGFTK